MRFDQSKYVAALCLSHVRHLGKFAVEVTTKRSTRIAGQLDNHVDALHVSALLTGLDELVKQGYGRGARVLVSSDLQSFVDAMQGNVNQLSLPMPMRKRLWAVLKSFTFTVQHRAEPALHISLNEWLFRLEEKELRGHAT
jgi:hypothetical protein